MQQSNIDILEKYRGHYRSLQDTQVLPYMDDNDKKAVLGVIHAEFDSRYPNNLWCGSCVVEMVNYAFRQMDAHLAEVNKKKPKKLKE